MLHRCSMLEWHPASLPTPRTLCRTRLPVGCPPAIPTAPLLPCLLPAPRTAQLKPSAYTGTGLTQDYQHGASSCLLLQHPLWAMSPVPLTGGHGASEIAGVPSAVPRWDLQQDPPYGCHGQGVLGQTKTWQVEDGGGKGGACCGRALGLSLPEVLLNSPDPSSSALATLQRRQGTKWETGVGLTVEAASTRHRRFPSKPMRAEDAQVSWMQLGHRIPSHSSHHALRGEHWGQVLMGKAGK